MNIFQKTLGRMQSWFLGEVFPWCARIDGAELTPEVLQSRNLWQDVKRLMGLKQSRIPEDFKINSTP